MQIRLIDRGKKGKMNEQWATKPSKRICRSCGKLLVGYRNAQGILKLKCPKCGLEEVGKKISRRHERCDFYVPPGNDIDN